MRGLLRAPVCLFAMAAMGAMLLGCPDNGPYTGAVKVSIQPGAAVDDGAQWQLDGGAWQDSASTLADVATGAHTVAFKVLTGWATPLSQSVTVTRDETLEVTAAYQKQYTLQVAKLGQGTVVPAAGTHVYSEGDEITLSATPAEGWEFEHWEGDLGSQDSTDTVVMNSDKTVMAVFAQVDYTLLVQAEGLGTVNPEVGLHTYGQGDVVNLSATAASGWRFDHWSGAISSTSATSTVTMDADKTVTAHFEYAPPSYSLSVTASPLAGGSVGLYPDGGSYEEGTVVALVATPALYYRFSGWVGAVTGTANPTTVTMDANKTVTANFVFDPEQYPVTVIREPEAGGSVSLNPAAGPYSAGTKVTLTATPAANYRFVEWEGALSGSTNPESFVMDEAKTVVARFEYAPSMVTVNVAAVPTGGGSIVMSPSGGSYVPGTEITLAAVPADGYRFHHWGGDLSGITNPLVLTVENDMIVQAVFMQLVSTAVLGVTADPPQGGYVTLDPAGGRYLINEQVQMLATAAANYSFLRWDGDVTGTDNPVELTMDADKTVTAVFDWVVKFEDAQLDAAVREALGLSSSGTLMASQLGGLTQLDAAGLGIATIEGLQWCRNLRQADLSNNLLGNLWPLVNNSGFTSGAALLFTGNQADWTSCDSLDRLRERGVTVFADDVCSDKEFVSLHDYWPLAVGNTWPWQKLSCPLGLGVVGDAEVTGQFAINGYDIWQVEAPYYGESGPMIETEYWTFVDGWMCYADDLDQLTYLPALGTKAHLMFPERIALGESFLFGGMLSVTAEQGPLSAFRTDIEDSPYGDLADTLNLDVLILGRCLGPIAGCGGIGEATNLAACDAGR